MSTNYYMKSVSMSLPYGSQPIHSMQVIPTQYESPLNGSTIVVGQTSKLIIEPMTDLNNLTIIFSLAIGGQTLSITCTKNISTLNVTNALFIPFAPVSITANTPLEFIYSNITGNWYVN